MAEDFDWEKQRGGKARKTRGKRSNKPPKRFYTALKGVEAPYLKRVNWVANHLHVPLRLIASDEPPDYAAVALLIWASENEDGFRTTYDARLTPSKTELNMQERFRDDGRTLKLLDAFQEEFDAKSPEGLSKEPAVSPGDHATGGREQVSAGGDYPGRSA